MPLSFLPNVRAIHLANLSSSAKSPFALTSNSMFARLNEVTNFLAVFVIFKIFNTSSLALSVAVAVNPVNGTLGKSFFNSLSFL